MAVHKQYNLAQTLQEMPNGRPHTTKEAQRILYADLERLAPELPVPIQSNHIASRPRSSRFQTLGAVFLVGLATGFLRTYTSAENHTPTSDLPVVSARPPAELFYCPMQRSSVVVEYEPVVTPAPGCLTTTQYDAMVSDILRAEE